ncbi:uncharacterized protein LOC131436673 isoform X2 [Malaya genurostris]|uniref:uncharacterized protein LOC131436673 isoform X2 n=1 Tax=Malaya genurostris TaxID=325434 RepID=UPI0026F3BB1F|nr:uncharacterized protein LOC131436673 isoform X2 [Malaya genurostris]
MFGRMGLFHSKVSPKNKPDTQLNILDPRSPTVNINRSPIGLECAQDIPSITKMRDLTTDLTEILDNVQTPDRVMGEKLQSIFDPRSPSLFVRTPLILDETNASTVSLKGVSLEYEEISCEEELSFGEKSLSFKECEDIPIITITAPDEEASSLFSDISLNTELKTEIDSIIQKLYDAETDTHSEENEDNKPDVQKEKREDNSNTQQTNIYQEETRVTVETPKKEKMLNNKSSGNATQRTPLGCVTNVKTPVNGASELRKTALLGQMKQNAATLGGSAELAHGRRSLPRSKIPTLRMK